jgi:hypothetical protein
MTTDKPQGDGSEPAGSVPTESAQNGTTPPSGGCSDCDLAEIDDMACTAKKFAKQAEVMNEIAGDLETDRTQYDDARKKYTDARDAATTALHAIRTVLDELADQLRCRLTDEQRTCLEKACCSVFKDIDACSGPRGCSSPCDDSDPGPIETSTDVVALAAEIQRRRANLADSTAYFATLIAEPDTISAQVLALTAEANQLATDVAAGGDASHVPSWYARWLILDTAATMARLGSGFDSVKAYVDCLCGVLRCLVSSWTVVAVLEGRKAELDCQNAAKQALCDKQKANVLQAVLAAYEECCVDEPAPPTSTPPPPTPTTQAPPTAA